MDVDFLCVRVRDDLNCLLFSRSVMSTPWTAACWASVPFTISQNLLKLLPIELMMPSKHLIICNPLVLLPSIFPSIRVFSNELALCIRQQKYGSFSISPSNEYFLQDELVGSTCSPRDSQESSPTSWFKIISSSVLSFLYSPTLTSIHDYWKNHSFDQTVLCQQSNVSAL